MSAAEHLRTGAPPTASIAPAQAVRSCAAGRTLSAYERTAPSSATHAKVASQHYAFLVSEDDFDRSFAIIQDRAVDHWADPGCTRPNEITHNDGGRGVYFTDPGGSDLEKPIGTVHYIDAKRVTHTVASGLAFPNGIVLRPGGKELLVGESKKNRILAFPVLGPGKLGEPKVLVDLPAKGEGQIDNQPDGIALDAEGNLYVAHYGMKQVQVVSPEGKVIRRYDGGNQTTSNVCFAGPKMDVLYMTGGTPGALFKLDLGVKGLTILPPKGK